MQKAIEMGQNRASAALPTELHLKIIRIRETIVPCQCYNLCRGKESWELHALLLEQQCRLHGVSNFHYAIALHKRELSVICKIMQM
jgi:hypothetical protein